MSELRRFLGARIRDFFDDEMWEGATAQNVYEGIGGDEVEDVTLEMVTAKLTERVNYNVLEVRDGKYSRRAVHE